MDMPFRTRDFLLFITIVAFLLVGITTTVSRDSSSGIEGLVYNFSTTSDESVTYEAVIPDSSTYDREGNMAALKAKIAKLGREQSIASSITEIEPEANTTTTTTDETVEEEGEEILNEVQYCHNYAEVNPAWRTDGIKFEIMEGARIVYRELGSQVVSVTSSSEISTTINNRDALLQLPLRTQPVAVKNCIQTDIIGIALDGSLIRNDEYGLYSIFGANTLVGYALDGFPIYGNGGSLKTDSCGGKMVQGGYRYYLSTERDGVLGCYSGVPVRI